MTTFGNKQTAMMPPEDDPRTGVHTATAMRAPQADPSFQPASVLMASNQYSGVGNGSSDNTLSVTEPYQKSMRDQLRAGEGTTP